MSRNYGLFKISTGNLAVSIFAGILTVLVLMGIVTQCVMKWSNVLADNPVLQTIVPVAYGLAFLIGVILVLRSEILFSSKNSEGRRELEENELIEMYRNLVLRKRQWKHMARRRHYVIIVEDLDRTENGRSVYHFLKELRKYYMPEMVGKPKYYNRVTFVVTIMPEIKLQMQYSLSKEENVYNKVFDYTMNLNKVNIDNFDAVLEGLLSEQRWEMNKIGLNVNDKDNVHEIPGMQWLIQGRTLSIRVVKDRLNDAVSLYERLMNNFGSDYADFEKCAVVAYLRSEYTEEYYMLDDRELDGMLEWYVGNHGSENDFLGHYKDIEKYTDIFLTELYRLIINHLIDANYRIYFYNYPKDSHLYSMHEINVRNMLVYNEPLNDKTQLSLQEVLGNNEHVITDALATSVELIGTLPDCILQEQELWNLAVAMFEEELLILLGRKLKIQEQYSETQLQCIKKAFHF